MEPYNVNKILAYYLQLYNENKLLQLVIFVSINIIISQFSNPLFVSQLQLED